MVSFKIEHRTSVEKDIQKIPHKFLQKIIERIDHLSKNPYPIGCEKISGKNSYYRIRVNDYRIIYQVIEQKKLIIIERIRHRKDVYKGL
ncbi:MAG: type II toxin-antitoxin system mRNA interferase toxin, RelE/StbE family [Bacteroidia bacterium]|jgi:mRNA interferase RelE/StbE|nr:type II toxin-antitoxin system mRNA interferase toxin, RelE/StbE family [Bacteroidia bacterium]